MIGRGSEGWAARLLCAAASLAFLCGPASSQTVAPPSPQPSGPDAAELDPSAPLDPMPDLGVAWPELNGKDTALPAPETQQAGSQTFGDGTGQVPYSWRIEGISSVGDEEGLLRAFRAESALETDRKKAAN